MLSIRSTLSAGVAASLVAVAGATVVSPAAERPLPVTSPVIELTAAIAPLLQPVAAARSTYVSAEVGGETTGAGDWIINVYNVVQPWVQYGVNLAAWAVSWLPWPIGLLGPQANILYSGWQPIGQSLAYGAAFLLDGQFDLVIPTLINGVKAGINNLVQGEIDWFLSFFPPLPPTPFPVFPTAPAVAATLPRASAATEAAVAAGPAPEAEPVPTLRGKRPVDRSASRTQRLVPAPAAAVTETLDRADASNSAAPSSAPKTPRAEKAKTGHASRARAGRAAR